MFELLFTHPLWAYRSGTFAFANAWPLWLLAATILAGIAVVAASLWRRRALGWQLLVPVGVLQSLLLALVVCLLWRPLLNVERVRDRENVLAVLFDASGSMAHADADATGRVAADARSRLQQVAAALQDGVLPELSRIFDLRMYSFSQRAAPLESLAAMPAPGSQTRIGDALEQVLQGAGTAPLAGVVLISDGAENGDSLSEDRLAQIAAYGVPIHAVGVGPERIEHDLELEHVDVPQAAPAGAVFTAQLRIRHAGRADTRLRVYDHDRLIAARALSLSADDDLTNMTIDLPAGDAGAHELRFALDPLPGERNLVNNARTGVLEVPARRRNILYVEGEPRWEYKFLRRAVEHDRALRLASLVRTTPNKHYRQGVSSPQELSEGFPADEKTLYAYDAVVIGSYEAATLRPAQHRLLKDFVDRRGGAVLMLAGRHGLGPGGWQDTPIAQALPVRLTGPRTDRFVQRPARAQPTLYGAESAIVRLDADPSRSAQRWKTLPQLADYQTLGHLKPGAIVLLEAAQRSRAPLLAWQHYGRGATFVLATASTLRWQMRMPPQDQSHETFWRQLLHALASFASEPVTLSAEHGVYDDESSVRVEAEVRNERFEPVPDAEVELQVTPERAAPFAVRMQGSGRNDGRYAATIEAAATGLYRLDLAASKSGQEIGRAVAHVLRNDGLAEHFAAQQHRAVLERLAEATGGQYWPLARLKELSAAIPYSKAGVVERQSLELWNLPVVFLVLLLLKTGEWLLRLRWGRL